MVNILDANALNARVDTYKVSISMVISEFQKIAPLDAKDKTDSDMQNVLKEKLFPDMEDADLAFLVNVINDLRNKIKGGKLKIGLYEEALRNILLAAVRSVLSNQDIRTLVNDAYGPYRVNNSTRRSY